MIDCGYGQSDRAQPQSDVAGKCSPHPLVVVHWLHALTLRYKRLRPKLRFPTYFLTAPPTSSFYPVSFLHMLPPSANFSHLPDAFKAKITSLIQEQLKPIVTELAVQQQTLLNNLALLKHNHNVNDYQTTRLEAIRDLEQSV